MTMRLNADTLRSEITQILAILSEVQEKLNEGIPGDETPADEMGAEIFQVQLVGALLLASNRLTSIVEVLDE